MKKFAVFVSGLGTNLQAIIDNVKSEYIKADLSIVISDNPDAYALTRAENEGVESAVFNPNEFKDKSSFEASILEKLDEKNIDFIVLAGFMRVLSKNFVNKYPYKILNIHPALLPAFKGAHAIKDAFDANVPTTGTTTHFVTKDVDSGPIILKKEIPIEKNDSLETLEEKIHRIEHQIYPETIKLFAEGKLKVEDQKVIILDN